MQLRFVKLLLVTLVCFAAMPAAARAAADAEEALSGTLSTNWSGFAATGGSYTAVGATWVVPIPQDATSSAYATDATWVGIGGIKKKDLIQAGTQAIVKSGRVVYRAWYELLPEYQRQIPLQVRGGDKVEVSLNEFSPGLWLLVFSNLTTGAQFNQMLTYQSSHSSVEWIEEMPSVTSGGVRVYAPLDRFGVATINDGFLIQKDKRKTIEDIKAHTITMISKAGKVPLAIPSQLSGGSFVVTRSGAVASPAKSGKEGEIKWAR